MTHPKRIVGHEYKRDRENLWPEGTWTGDPVGRLMGVAGGMYPMVLLCGNFELTK